jgi:hypothetical protein
MGIGATLIFLFFIFDRKTIRIEWDAIARFLVFMTLATFVRLSVIELMTMLDPMSAPSLPRQLLEMPKILFATVWWEDGFYVLPIFLAYKYCNKYFAHLIAILFSLHFGLGHAYQGTFGILVTSIYPVFISLKYGSKYGFGTVMISHVLYDYITYTTIVLAMLMF